MMIHKSSHSEERWLRVAVVGVAVVVAVVVVVAVWCGWRGVQYDVLTV
jgi:heme/copper-type cytochrome/quinol oxidase subunit 4